MAEKENEIWNIKQIVSKVGSEDKVEYWGVTKDQRFFLLFHIPEKSFKKSTPPFQTTAGPSYSKNADGKLVDDNNGT